MIVSSWRAAVVTRVAPRTARIASLFFPATLGPFTAGQHVDIRLTADDGYEARRSYSIASAPGSAEVELLVERLDDGEVSPFLHDVVRAGDTLEWRGPIGGHFVWNAASGGPLLLVAGGSGIAPLLAILRDRATTAPDVDALLLYGARTRDDLVYLDELLALESRDPRFAFVAATSRDVPHRAGDFAGRIDRALVRTALDRRDMTPRVAYVCGSTPFVEAVTTALVAEGVSPSAIRAERYGGAAA